MSRELLAGVLTLLALGLAIGLAAAVVVSTLSLPLISLPLSALLVWLLWGTYGAWRHFTALLAPSTNPAAPQPADDLQ